jgi:ABC-2 type transport system permease protein
MSSCGFTVIAMLEFFRYDVRKRVRESVTLTLGMVVLTVLDIWVYPSFRDSFDEDELLDAYPQQLLKLFDIETMSSLEGFLSFELYAFGWVILLGLYFAYSAAGIIATDLDRGRLDSLLAMPVSRPRLLVERFGALALPILTVNLVTAPVVLVGGELVGESLSVADVFAVHLLSVPYLFACAGIGILCSVVFDRASIAQRVALGVTFALFMGESLLAETEYEPLGAIAPMRYFDQTETLLASSYDILGAGVLVGMTIGLVVLAQAVFVRRDI